MPQSFELARINNYKMIVSQIEQVLKNSSKQKMISAFIGNKLYYFFKINNKVVCVSERFLTVVAGSLGFTLVVLIRKICYQYKIGKKIKIQLKKAIEKTRGGQFESLHKESFEQDDVGLSEEELLVKSIIQRCLKPDKIYRIVNLEMVQKIQELIKFESTEKTRLVTYEVFVHILIICSKRWLKIGFFVTISGLQGGSLAAAGLLYSPIIGTTLLSMCLGFMVSPQITFLPFLIVLSGTTGLLFTTIYPILSLLRQVFFIDCENYVQEFLYNKPTKLLSSTEPKVVGNCETSSGFFYTRTPTIKEDVYLETSQNVPFCEEVNPSNFKIDTLDGSLQNYKHADGSTRFGWFRKFKEHLKPTKSKNSGSYSELKRRTRTLGDCIRSDTTENREATKRVINAIEKDYESRLHNNIINDAIFDAGLGL